jgi:5-methyltetrahydropteroyltriglutamate--homocysteine methyltransferase
MQASRDRILTSHAGSLPRPDELIEANRAREAEGAGGDAGFGARLRAAVADVVRRQADLGISVPGDGEFGKSMGHRVNYRAWWSYSFQRLGGLELGTTGLYDMPPRRSRPGEVVLSSFADRRDRLKFAAAYADPDSGITTGPRPALWPVCVAPLSYTGHDAIRSDIANFKAALAAAGVEEGFMTSIAPGSASRIANRFYRTEEEFLFACADAMREEYRAIVDAGLVLQLDDPAIAENWDMVNPEPSAADYRKFSMTRVEALNHAIRGLPEDRIRFHLCWGSWHGPHTTDVPMRDIVEVMLAVKCRAYSFEAGNVRHEHEWKVWRDVKLPDGKLILPGVVSHATNVVEHPELVAERIVRFAEQVGRERVIASTDCGLGGRVHPQIAWAKLEALAHGAELATRQLWRSARPAAT